jgi:cytochrome d ubiquinol oxidase subunit I
MVIASFLTVSVLIAGISAWYLLKKRHLELSRSTFSLAMAAVLLLAPLQLLIGDLHGLNTFHHQPLKVAAMEGRWETMRGAPLTLFAIPSMTQETNLFAIDIPKLGSLILTHESNGEIRGLKSVPPQDRPYVPIVFYSFRIMILIGLIFIATAGIGQYLRMRNQLYDREWFLKWCLFISPLGFVAVLMGWFTTETGRQPWIVYGLLRTHDAASSLSVHSVLISCIAFFFLYFTFLTTFIFYLVKLIRKGPVNIALTQRTDQLTAWVEEK